MKINVNAYYTLDIRSFFFFKKNLVDKDVYYFFVISVFIYLWI